jgi:NAD(P)-dependent dehydrogenase (short-subunit alcohol dehydrogenase family)
MDHVVVIGGTSGLGRAVAARYAAGGHRVTVAGRDAERAASVARELGGEGVAVDLSRPETIAAALAGLPPVNRLVLTATVRDRNTVRDFTIPGAVSIVVTKLVGYTEVAHVLGPHMPEGGSIVLFGGLAKDRPYPGSTTVTTVNAGVAGLVKSLAVELAPVRVNAIHPGAVGDSPAWSAPEVADPIRARTPTKRMPTTGDVVDAVTFLLENPGVNGVNLILDAGLRLG